MGDISLLFILSNIIIFCVIFWLLTSITEIFFKKKEHYSKRDFYECGFKSISDINIQINLNFSILCIFLILYDIELIYLVPFLFNTNINSVIEILVLFIFIVMINLSLLFDYKNNSLNWQY